MTDCLSFIEIITEELASYICFSWLCPLVPLNIPMNPRMVTWQALLVLFLVFLSHFMDTRGKVTSVAVSLCCGYLRLATWPPLEGYIVVD